MQRLFLIEIGGIFAIKNNVSNKWYVDSSPDLAAAKNRMRAAYNPCMAISRGQSVLKDMRGTIMLNSSVSIE